MEIGTVQRVDIEEKMQVAYLDYAMSVIVARALPDARDGLKPVQRRILYAMHDMGLRPSGPHKKSARIVGEVLGKYHPHSDTAVYDAMVRMAQDFSLRYPLVDGQGNFGSVDGDSAAAMRYTEAKLAAVSNEMLLDLDKDTVDSTANFDDTLQEPSILPAAIPNLLVNGATGIAVGMSTSIPPHNLAEVCDALVYILEHWAKRDDVTVEDLMRFIRGPDFPTGGVIYRRMEEGGEDMIAHAYSQGRGGLIVRALAHVEQMTRSRSRIVVTELPYQVNKSRLIERIALLVRSGKIEGVTDLRDESDRHGMRLVIELTRTADPQDVLSALFRLTPMESTFSLIMLALVDGEPRMLTLKKALLTFLEHRQVIVMRRSRYELDRAKERAHILEGLLVALDNLDEVISVIRHSRTSETAHTNLRRRFKLSDAQVQAILDMPLKRLAALEYKRIRDEYQEKQRLIKRLRKLLGSPSGIRGMVKSELRTVREEYADARRTRVLDVGSQQLNVADLVSDEAVWVAVSRQGLVARTAAEDSLRVPSRPKDVPIGIVGASTRDTLYLLTADGRAAAVPVHQLAEGRVWEGAGAHYATITPLSHQDSVVAILSLPASMSDKEYVCLATRRGMVKRVALADLPGVSAELSVVVGLGEDDSLVSAALTTGQNEIMLTTSGGQAIRFKESEVRPMGLLARGVLGIKFGTRGDFVVSLDVMQPRSDLFVIGNDGRAKRTSLAEYPTQGRHGQGVIATRFSGPDMMLAGACVVRANDSVIVITEKGAAKTTRAKNAPRKGRAALGKEMIALRKQDTVIGVFVPSPRIEVNRNQ